MIIFIIINFWGGQGGGGRAARAPEKFRNVFWGIFFDDFFEFFDFSLKNRLFLIYFYINMNNNQ